MSRPLPACALAWLLSLLAPQGLAAEPVDAKPIRVVGLTVGATDLNKEDYEFPPVTSGIEVHLLVTHTGAGAIIGVSEDESKIVRFTDDKGTDFLKPADSRFGPRSPIGPFPKPSKDGKKTLITLRSDHAPATGASRIKVMGGLVVEVAQGVKTLSADKVALKPGKIAVTGLSLELTKAQAEKSWQDKPVTRMEFRIKGDGGAYKALRLVDAQGKEIETSGHGSMWGQGVRDLQIDGPADLKEINVRLDLYDGLKKVELPLALDQSLGM